MGYLRYHDYLQQIQDKQLKALITNNQAIRTLTERIAQAEITSYLVQKFDTVNEFTDTNNYSYTAVQNANQLVELNFPAYDPTATYALNTLTTNTVGLVSQCYICTTAIGTPESFNPAHWLLLGNLYDLFYLQYPYPLFNQKNYYNKGDNVFWKGKCYTCQIQTQVETHEEVLQHGSYSNQSFYNVFPDDIQNGLQYWGVGTAYSVVNLVPTVTYAAWSAGTYTIGQRVTFNGVIWRCIVTSTTVQPSLDIVNWQPETWVSGDNRSAQLVQKMCYIVIRHLCVRIAPRNIPNVYIDNYNQTIDWLKDAINGIVVADIPEIQNTGTLMTRYGGRVKNINGYVILILCALNILINGIRI